jgi:ABC-type transporter Mla MlaB component
VVGVYNKSGDLKINVCKAKALTNMRASQSEKKVRGCVTCSSCNSLLQRVNDAGLAVLLHLFRCVCGVQESVYLGQERTAGRPDLDMV